MTPLVINVIVIMILCFFIIKCSCFHLCFIENYLNPLPICIPPMLAIIPLPPTLVVATKRPKKKEKGKKRKESYEMKTRVTFYCLSLFPSFLCVCVWATEAN